MRILPPNQPLHYAKAAQDRGFLVGQKALEAAQLKAMGGSVATPEQRTDSVVPVPEKNGAALLLSLTEYLFVGAKISFSVWVNSEMQYIEQIGVICK
jgi:hypothetical protein